MIYYHISLYLNIVSAVFWIGGMLFTAAVLVPASRHKIIVSNRGGFFKLIGEKFSRISWVLFLILIITGVTNLTTRGVDIQLLFTLDFWTTSYGGYLGNKLLLFAIVLVISGLHDFWFGPEAARLMDTEPDSRKTLLIRKISSWLGRVNLLLGLVILYYAIRITRG